MSGFCQESQQIYIYGGPALIKYSGELGNYDNTSGSLNIGVQFNKKKKLNGSLNFGLGSASGQDVNFGSQASLSTDPDPNNFFKSQFVYFSYELKYHLIKRADYHIYISQGLGVFRFNPQDDLGNDLQDLNNTRNTDETYRNATVMLPIGVGGTYFLPNKFGIGLQMGFYNTLTNYLDNISELGDESGDNLLGIRLAVYAPLN